MNNYNLNKFFLIIFLSILKFNSVFSIVILPDNISNFSEFNNFNVSFLDFINEYIKYLKNQNLSEVEKKIFIDNICNSSEDEIVNILFDEKLFKEEVVKTFKEIVNENFKVIFLARLAVERLANLILGDEKVPYNYKIYKENRNELWLIVNNIKKYADLKKNELKDFLLDENYEKLINFLNKYSNENFSYKLIDFLKDLEKLGKSITSMLFKSNNSSGPSIGLLQMPGIILRFNQLKK